MLEVILDTRNSVLGNFKNKSDFFLNIKKLSEGNNYTNIKDQKKRKMLASLFFFHYIKNQFDEILLNMGIVQIKSQIVILKNYFQQLLTVIIHQSLNYVYNLL